MRVTGVVALLVLLTAGVSHGSDQLADDLCAQIQTILGVPTSGDAALEAMRRAWEEPEEIPPNPPTFPPDQLDAVSVAVLQGVRPDAFTDKFYELVWVGGVRAGIEPHSRNFGLRQYREAFVEQLWAQAKACASRDPARAERYAKAAVVILALERTTSPCAQVMRFEQDDAFGDLLRLPRSELTRLRSLIRSLQIPPEYGSIRKSASAAFDRLVDSDPRKPLPKEDLEFVLNQIEAAWKLLPLRPDIRGSSLCSDLWALACLSRVRHDSPSLELVRTTCQNLAKASSSNFEKRLLKEAADLPGARIRKKPRPPGSQPADFKPKHP